MRATALGKVLELQHDDCEHLHLLPQIAHVGLYEIDLVKRGIKFDTYIKRLEDNDRAICDSQTEGECVIHAMHDRECALLLTELEVLHGTQVAIGMHQV